MRELALLGKDVVVAIGTPTLAKNVTVGQYVVAYKGTQCTHLGTIREVRTLDRGRMLLIGEYSGIGYVLRPTTRVRVV